MSDRTPDRAPLRNRRRYHQWLANRLRDVYGIEVPPNGKAAAAISALCRKRLGIQHIDWGTGYVASLVEWDYRPIWVLYREDLNRIVAVGDPVKGALAS